MNTGSKSLIQKLGLLGILSFLSYTAAVIFAPLAYPGYQWMQQAVSDLSATTAPSRDFWNQLSCLYALCGIVTLMLCWVYVQGQLTRTLRVGIALYTLMNWISAVGYTLFPLTASGYAGTDQDVMHMIVTALVVLLSIASLLTIIIGGFRARTMPSLAICACIALGLMLAGAMGSNLVPPTYFGIFERFSVFSAAGFTAVLGFYLWLGFPQPRRK